MRRIKIIRTTTNVVGKLTGMPIVYKNVLYIFFLKQ